MRIVFMGTPDFAVPCLDALVRGGHDVLAVVTQPDKPKGRGNKMIKTPVKERAEELGIPVYQPVRVRKDEEFLNTLKELNPDVIVVTAFGQILPASVLELPKYGCINVHASLLPKYRGAAPIQWAVINGDEESGVTTMQMDVGLDTGDMMEKAVVKLDPKETGGSLFDRLSLVGGELILETLKKVEDGTAVRTPQKDEEATHVTQLTKEMGKIDWTKDAVSIERLIRGLNPWPSAFTTLNDKTLKIWDADVKAEDTADAACGQVTAVTKKSVEIQTGSGTLVLREVQLEGKKRMDCDAFLRGYEVTEGIILS